jgi:translation initiation factor IF-2
MAGQRIHQIAADWGKQSKELVERLEKMGIKGKKAQSVLSEAEAERLRDEMGISRADDGAGEIVERTVELHAGTHDDRVTGYKTITEKRIKRGVVLRRTKRTQLAGDSGVELPPMPPVPAGLRAATTVALSPESLNAYDTTMFGYAASMPASLLTAAEAVARVEETPEIEEAAPHLEIVEVPAAETEEAVPEQAEEEAVVVEPLPEPEEVVPEVEPKIAAAETGQKEEEEEDFAERSPVEEPDKLAAELLSHAEAREKEAEEAARSPEDRILGRIDLSKKATPAMPAQPATPANKEAPASETEKPGRKRKRKVVRKEDMFDAFERSFQGRQRRPMKKRVAPGQRVQKTELTTPKASKRVIKINEATTPGELAKSMGIKAGEVLGVLMRLGVMKSINDVIDFDTATLVADEFQYTVENTAVSVESLLQAGAEEAIPEEALESRPPVVTVMGHVDHGKTSLLDVIREANVVASEAGGITQHIGAYMVPTSQGEICFLDTPGHAAFTAMRARGASVTDLVILVVAADDGVMPQTIEAIDHARAAGIPLVVAVNKIDKPDANPDRVKQQLAERGVQPEDWGGDTQFVPVSALKKTGIDQLLEAVSLQAQLLELKACPTGLAHGIVIEARLDRGRGPVATVLVQQGTLQRGDYYVCGETTGRVRAMTDHTGQQVDEAGPSHPVELIGLDAVPSAGDSFDVLEDLSRATQVAEHRRDAARKVQAAASARMSLEDLQAQVAAGEVSELKCIIKADVDGSAEALKQALEKLSTDEVALNVIHTGVGAINESDVQLALASQAIVIGFHVRPEGKARTLAEREGVDIRLHTIIYEAIDEVKAALEGLLAPEYQEAFEGRAEVRETFTVPGGMTVAGCYVTDGKITRGAHCRLLRDNVVVHTGSLGSLRRFKDDVREVQQGYECGIGIERYNDVKPGDVIECFRMEAVKRSLDESRRSSSAEASA